MLAQNFKTAAELNLTDKRFEALLGVLRMLERDELKHVALDETRARMSYRKPRDRSFVFNMDDIYTYSNCGTAACIAGACDLYFNSDFVDPKDGLADIDEVSKELYNLFCPDRVSPCDWKEISSSQAAMALRSYLTTGEPRWDLALA